MVKINLIGKKRREAGGGNWAVYTSLALFGIFALYFIGLSLFVVIKLVLIRSEQAKVNGEIETISREMTADNEKLRSFILSKYIVQKIASLNKEKFPYKTYLDRLVTLMPEGVVLKNVDFANKGWVAVAAQVPSPGTLGRLEGNLKNDNLISASPFSTIFSEEVVRDKLGSYNIKLQFEINKNGGQQ